MMDPSCTAAVEVMRELVEVEERFVCIELPKNNHFLLFFQLNDNFQLMIDAFFLVEWCRRNVSLPH